MDDSWTVRNEDRMLEASAIAKTVLHLVVDFFPFVISPHSLQLSLFHKCCTSPLSMLSAPSLKPFKYSWSLLYYLYYCNIV